VFVTTKTALVGSALAAITALSMTACAPVGGSGVAQQPVANQAADTGDATDDTSGDTGDTSADDSADDSSDTGDTSADTPNVTLTSQLIGTSVKRMGKVVTDQKGWILYRFDKDTQDPAKSNCKGDCEKVWPPAYTDGNPQISGVDKALVGTVTRDDGTKQITLNGWPLYRYIGDKKPGQWTGQAVGGVWYVTDPNGKKNLTCVPNGTPKAATPPSSSDAGSTPSGDSNY